MSMRMKGKVEPGDVENEFYKIVASSSKFLSNQCGPTPATYIYFPISYLAGFQGSESS